MRKIREDSTAFRVLTYLYDAAENGWDIPAIFSSIGNKEVSAAHLMTVCAPILTQRLVVIDAAGFWRITGLGVRYMDEFNGYPRAVNTNSIATRRVPLVTSVVPRSGSVPYRPGSDEHLSIPSLMGNTRKLPSGEIIEEQK